MDQNTDTFFNKLKHIRAIVLDVDGVLTNGNMLLLENGEWLRQMSFKDGFAIEYAIKKRYKICIVSENGSEAIGKRMDAMGVSEIYFNAEVKLAALEKFVIDHEVDIHEILYMGDDIPDISCMKAVGLAVCPQDAAPEVKNISHYIAQAKGGEGCVREVLEMVMKSHKIWDF
jgi:3-deoxy-D-manno-octulosonate 8-phosphate phosphatase (KDO 8-P phosphatase)